MAVAKKKPKIFFASLQVTRVENWCVEAANAEEARAMLARGEGDRIGLGDCIFVEVQEVSE
jgi:hypothetical protein